MSLLTGTTNAGSRVTSTRMDTWRPGELPALSVYTLDESVDDASLQTAPRELTRELELKIVAWVADKDSAPAGDAMDDIAMQVESVMDVDPYLGGRCVESILGDTTVQILADGDPLLGLLTMTYRVTYRTSPVAPTLPAFAAAGITTQVVGAGADNAAHDLAEVPQ